MRTSGMTLMEVTVSSAILAVAFVVVLQLMKHMGEDVYAEQVESDLQKRVTARIYDLTSELQTAVASDAQLLIKDNGTAVGAGVFGDSIEFRVPSGVDTAGQPVYNAKVRFRWVASARETAGNGVDDDQNGIIDDGSLVREEIDPATGMVASTVQLEANVPQTARISRVDDPHYGQVLRGFSVLRSATNDRQIVVTIQRSGDLRQNTANGTVSTASATRTVFLENQ